MNSTPAGIKDALLEVRKAYRLLHDYQRMVMDALNYVGIQFGLTYMGGWPKFSAVTPRLGGGNLNYPAWNWLNLMAYDFHFTRDIEGGKTLMVSMLLISDTGYYCSKEEAMEQKDPADFLPPEQSGTKIGFVISVEDWQPAFMEDREAIRVFIETGGELPAEFVGKGIITRCYDLARLMSEDSTNTLIDELIAVANKSGIPLQRHVK